MGYRELFVYTTGTRTIETILENVSKKIPLNSDDIQTIYVHCKAEVLKDFSTMEGHFTKGTIGAVITPYELTSDEINEIFPTYKNSGFRVIDMGGLPEDYEKLFKDSPITIGGKTYYPEKNDN